MDFHFASVFETIADAVPERFVSICDGERLTWGEYDKRASRLASAYRKALSSEPGSVTDTKVGLYLHNCNEYLEAQFAAFKLQGTSVNVNYRYRADELVYLLDNADVEVLVYHATYAERILEIRDRLPRVKLFIQVEDESGNQRPDFAADYETLIACHEPDPRFQRDPNALYILYTGGTTGMPKGVMYEQGYFCQYMISSGAKARGMTPPTCLAEIADYVKSMPVTPVTVVACPMMHGTGMWTGCFAPNLTGGTTVSTRKLGLDADQLWHLVEEHRATGMVIVGDAFGQPLVKALDEAEERGKPYDLSSLKRITSSGVMWSMENKQGFLRHADMILSDRVGSSESSMGGSLTTRKSLAAGGKESQTAKFDLIAGAKVFTEEGRSVEPGSGDIGMIASSALVPLGYYKDENKSAATFKTIDGVRYSFPGDFATVEADGSITLLGRGSQCINTAGEKVFPEEVEEVVKKHASVLDCLVVGVPDERFGQRIVAVTSLTTELSEETLKDFTKEHLAGYKTPREVLFVDEVKRAPNGKADYGWAKEFALQELVNTAE
ncbi:acyl-CoA synthetase [Maricurvus nonylphenolicus]|uniref:AMP-binding protein n=1 Tax=Maricurvus nonylphenolicus TaxID=1008307 RepID=UPI0036F32310